MGSQAGFWNRDELYEEVWATPMQILAKKYGISDVGLAKVCRKLSIPLPGRGYWARKEAGQKVEHPALPALKEKVVLRKPAPRPEPPKPTDLGTPEEVAQIERLQRMSGAALLKRGDLSHPLIIQTRSALKSAHVNDRKILWSSDSYLDVRVSRACVDRALRVMAALISTIEHEAFTVAIQNKRSEKRAQTVARIYGQDIAFAVIEKVDRVEIASPPKGGLLERVLTYGGRPVTFEPSGKLSAEALTAWGDNRRRWKDGKVSLEEQIPAIVAGFIQLPERPSNRTEARRRRTGAAATGRRASSDGRIDQCRTSQSASAAKRGGELVPCGRDARLRFRRSRVRPGTWSTCRTWNTLRRMGALGAATS